MATQAPRWVEVTPSQFAHEAEGLNLVRAVLPPHPPFRAWSNFEFRDNQGRWGEVDLLVLGRRRLHLVELKFYSGTLRGDDLTWRRDGHRAEDSPLKLARRKAQRLAGKLRDELYRWAHESGTKIPDPHRVIPYVQECVFLHHPDLRCELTPSSRIDLFGLDGHESEHGLPGISQRLLEPPSPDQRIHEEVLTALLARIGLVQRRQREVGSWVVDEEPLAEGEGWQEWPAFHRVATTNRARIRFLVTPPGSTKQERAQARRVAEHEYRIMSRLSHDGLLVPKDLVDGDLGVGLVYDLDGRFQRLDLWLADQASGVPAAEQLSILRQVAEVVGYAHRNKVVHRGLTPRAVLVRPLPDGGLRAVVGDWQGAGAIRVPGQAGNGPTGGSSGVTGLLGAFDSGAIASGQRGSAVQRLDAVLHPGAVDVDRRVAEAFQAPEGIYSRDADRIRLDVFALGALAYYLLAGRPPAADRAGLRERLHRDRGLDLAADLPQVPSAVRTLVLEATRPSVSERTPDVRTFLELLSAAERAVTSSVDEEVADPLEAAPGAVLGGGRFRLERRLGSGSTAVGLLVTDLTVPHGDAVRVLKVAIDDAAAGRLAAEADVLRGLHHPRLVRLVDGPIEVGTRTALVLENAGEQTLADQLRSRSRVSLDLLERWGTDLFEALVALDGAGVDHRDIKPSNLGVRESRGRHDRAKHLVLFDFSLARAGATALTAGTPDYLDPFLGTKGRDRYDSAAERYSAAVVLFEMATGALPRYGDGQSDPAAVPDEASVEPAMFDPAVAPVLARFFAKALARDARQRHHTAAEMLAAWRSAFAPVPTTVPDDADRLAAAATPTTPLAGAGLSARALSAVESLGVVTVADLVAVDAVRLNRLSGAAEPTRREVKERARQWRERLGAEVTGRGRRSQTSTADASLPDAFAAAELLVATGTARAPARRAVARLLLGLDGGLDAFATRAELATVLDVTRPRASQQLGALQEAWAASAPARDLLDTVWEIACRSIASLGGVATVGELVGAILATVPPTEPGEPAPDSARVAAGLLRSALDRAQALRRADAGSQPVSTRRREQRVALVASDAALLDPAEAIGRAADRLVEQAGQSAEPVVPAGRVRARLREAWVRAGGPETPELLAGDRLPRLAAALSATAVLSGAGELHHRGLDPAHALTLALAGVGAAQPVTAQEVRDRVRARFPGLAPLPDRPRLDELIEQARLGLVYDDADRAFRPRTRIADTGGLLSRPQTHVVPLAPALVAGGHHGHRLAESVASRSFLALGVDALQADKAAAALNQRFGAQLLDLTGVLIAAMKEQAAAAGLPWDLVRAADAATPGSREAHGLTALVQRALPAVEAAIADAVTAGGAPILLTEASPLARYGHLGLLSTWSDLTTRRGRAVWLLVPQLLGNTGAVIDGRPLPLAAPGQFLRLDTDWINAGASRTPAAEGARS